MSNENDRYPAGRQPYDPLNGFKVGALAGGIVGVLPAIFFGPRAVVTMLAGAAIGGAIGFWSQKRTMVTREPPRS